MKILMLLPVPFSTFCPLKKVHTNLVHLCNKIRRFHLFALSSHALSLTTQKKEVEHINPAQQSHRAHLSSATSASVVLSLLAGRLIAAPTHRSFTFQILFRLFGRARSPLAMHLNRFSYCSSLGFSLVFGNKKEADYLKPASELVLCDFDF